jgi:hypothetical protein
MITTNNVGNFELKLTKKAAFGGMPQFTFEPLTHRVLKDPANKKKGVIEVGNPKAQKFLMDFAGATKDDAGKFISEPFKVIVARSTDIQLLLVGKNECEISLRSQTKNEANELAILEQVELTAQIKLKGGVPVLYTQGSLPDSVGGEENALPPVGVAPKSYEEMSIEELATLCTTRNIEAYTNTGQGALKTQYKPQNVLIRSLRSWDKENAAKK